VRFFSTNFITSALPHLFLCRRFVSNVMFTKRTSLTVAASWTLMPKTLFELCTIMFEKRTWRMSACVSV
jgi:hypothetical protein